jgi:hypothetical protein
MKTYYTVLFVFYSMLFVQAQSLVGAWEGKVSIDSDHLRGDFKSVWIFTKNHYVVSLYETKTGNFMGTKGGAWSLENNMLTETVEFDFQNPEEVGATNTFEIEFTANELSIKDDSLGLGWKRIDNGTPGALNGAWLMSGRKRNGEFSTRDTNRPRKTMKILSGTRFQLIAYNTETKQFMGTGGGTYTTIDGKYTENIEFFSRDDSRVGASLEFNFELKDGDWHHSGFSSKGAPLYEVWSLRN